MRLHLSLRTSWLVSFLVFAGCEEDAPTSLTIDAGDQLGSVDTDEGARTFYLHVPPGLSASDPVPLLVVLHGAGGTARGVRAVARFDEAADENGFLTVYPEGLANTWRVVGSDRDRDFITAVIEQVRRDLPVDPARVYAAGISQGALMTHRLGCSTFSPVSAIASAVIASFLLGL